METNNSFRLATIYDSFNFLFFFFSILPEKKEDFDEISPEILAARYDRRNIRANYSKEPEKTNDFHSNLVKILSKDS